MCILHHAGNSRRGSELFAFGKLKYSRDCWSPASHHHRPLSNTSLLNKRRRRKASLQTSNPRIFFFLKVIPASWEDFFVGVQRDCGILCSRPYPCPDNGSFYSSHSVCFYKNIRLVLNKFSSHQVVNLQTC